MNTEAAALAGIIDPIATAIDSLGAEPNPSDARRVALQIDSEIMRASLRLVGLRTKASALAQHAHVAELATWRRRLRPQCSRNRCWADAIDIVSVTGLERRHWGGTNRAMFQEGVSIVSKPATPDAVTQVSAIFVQAPIIAAFVAAVVTAVGWLMNHRSQQQLAARKARLELVDRQLEKLYGPLHVLCEAGRTSYATLLKKLGRTQKIFDEDPPPTEEQIREWFHWMKHVLHPMNEAREKLILDNCHLIVEDQVPPSFLEFSAHVAGYRAILPKWEKGDFTERYTRTDFPRALDEYARTSFAALKKEQASLIGLLKK